MKKRRLVSLLAAFLAAALLPAQAFGIDYFEEWGDQEFWTDEQWEQQESWTSEETDEYYRQYEEYLEQQQSWTDEQWDAYDQRLDEFYAETQKARRLKEKAAHGFTSLDGINVFVNGKAVDFGASGPYIVGGAMVAPVKPIFDALGAETSFDAAEKSSTVTLGGKSLTMKPGVTEAAITEGLRTDYVDLAVAPFISGGGQTFAPVRAVADALSLELFYSYEYQAAQIVDEAALAAEIDEKFTIFNKLLLRQPSSFYDASKNYKIDGSVAAELRLYGDRQDDTASASIDVAALLDPAASVMDIKAGATLDLGGLGDIISGYLDEAGGGDYGYIVRPFSYTTWMLPDMLTALDGASAEFILSDGDLYLRSPLINDVVEDFASMTGEDLPVAIGEDDWLYAPGEGFAGEDFNPFDVLSVGGLDLGLNKSVGELMADDYLRWYSDTYSFENKYQDAVEGAALCERLFGDRLFQRSGSLLTARVDGDRLVAAVDGENEGYYPYYDYDNPFYFVVDNIRMLARIGHGFEYTISIREAEDGEGAEEWSIEGRTKKTAEDALLGLSFSLKEYRGGGEYSLEAVGHYVGSLALNGKIAIAETDQRPRTAPPEGDTVLNVDEWDGEDAGDTGGEDAEGAEGADYGVSGFPPLPSPILLPPLVQLFAD
ncbi:MAG: copper amine oxidase N-terminal domain-containing protein [Clostridiales Family XIII bacterium]|nr:copper amine oxidase N-terminal domain-containing protein [Clostridiales Family XIII bacterium]